MKPRFYMVDVFAEQAYSGNPLAVFVGAEELSSETMQLLAAEMNFSETTFVTSVPEEDGGYRVRVFTPSREIAFTGHPILGTAWVIRKHLSSTTAAEICLNLEVGQVPVTFESSADGTELVWFQAPPMILGATSSAELFSQALGLSVDDIDTSTPIQMISAGTSAMIVPLRSQDALQRSKLDLEAYSSLAAQGFPPLVYVCCSETHQPQTDLCVRFFFEAHGVREDPATGNGAACLGAYLLEHKDSPALTLSIRIEQGYEVRRPSLIMLRAKIEGNHYQVSVGGYVIPTVQGELQ